MNKFDGSIAVNFETDRQLKPTHAAKIIGVSYTLWKKLRTGEKELQKYHIASIEAHQALSKTQFQKLAQKRIEK